MSSLWYNSYALGFLFSTSISGLCLISLNYYMYISLECTLPQTSGIWNDLTCPEVHEGPLCLCFGKIPIL